MVCLACVVNKGTSLLSHLNIITDRESETDGLPVFMGKTGSGRNASFDRVKDMLVWA